MSTITQFPSIAQAQVFARLAEGLKAGATVVTPNRRLALALKREFDDAQAAAGLAAWDSADILSFSAFVERAYDDALYSDLAANLPLLLASAQEQALWEGIIRGSEAGGALLAVPETARLVREAWELAQAWHLMPRLKNVPLNEDGKAFQGWAQRYEYITKRDSHTDSARLAGLAAPLFGQAQVRTPKFLVCYGFDIITPQQSALLARLKNAGCEVVSAGPQLRRSEALRVACKDNRDEIYRAAVWARMQLESGAARIGVVVPDLARRRATIARVFSAVMAPDYALPGAAQRVLPFNISLGLALNSYPLVNAAMLVLQLAGREIDFEPVSRLLRSPFLAGGEAEMARRARLDIALRKRAEPVVTIDRLQTLMARDGAGCPVLAQRLSALAEFRKTHLFVVQAPSVWAKRISEALSIVGFPGERSLDSAEYQTLKKWHELIASFAALDRVVQRAGYTEAMSRLRRMAADTLFQPETPEVPIQILGVLEAAGMAFDRLWVMGLNDEAWPPGPRPNPFLPIEVQRAAGLPQGSAVESLELAGRLTKEWLSSADEVVLSYPEREEERELKPSPLIIDISERPLSLPTYAIYRDAIHDARRLEQIEDRKAPALDKTAAVSAGAAAIKDYAACPFRAFALHRLGAQGIDTPHTGLDALERGTLVHRVLAQAWAQLKNKDALDAINAVDLETLLKQAAEEAVVRIKRDRPTTLSGRFAEIERQRLVRLARAWLEAEKQRIDFTVVATEDKRRVEIGGLGFNVRLDRVDQVEDGRRIVIDYKTGAVSVGAWLGARPEEPQLPLYLVTTEPDAAAIAFARVKAGEMKFATLARDSDLLPQARTLPDNRLKRAELSWDKQIDAWRNELARIAAGFASGDAEVQPKQYPNTCRYCDVKPLCRIHERLENTLFDNESSENDEDAA